MKTLQWITLILILVKKDKMQVKWWMTDQFKEFLASGKSILKVQYKILMKITNSLIQSVSTHNIQIKEKMINNMKTSILKKNQETDIKKVIAKTPIRLQR